MINQARRKQSKSLPLRSRDVNPARAEVWANPSPVMKSILGGAPGALAGHLLLEAGPTILSEECAVQMTPKQGLISGTKEAQHPVQFQQVSPFKPPKGGTMTQLKRKDMSPGTMKPKHQLIPSNSHQAEDPKAILNQSLTSHRPSKTMKPRQKD